MNGTKLAVGILKVLSREASLGEFVRAFEDAVIPEATGLVSVGGNSVFFTVQAKNMPVLKALWERYQDGTLQRNLQDFLVTEDIRQLANGEEVIVTVHIDEQEFNNACLSLIIAENQGKYLILIINVKYQSFPQSYNPRYEIFK